MKKAYKVLIVQENVPVDVITVTNEAKYLETIGKYHILEVTWGMKAYPYDVVLHVQPKR